MKLSFFAATAVIAISGLSHALNLGGYVESTHIANLAQIDALPLEFAQQGGPVLLPQATLDEYWALFDNTVKNGKRDGQMDKGELNKAMIALGQPESERTDEKLQSMIDKYDLNGDGTLSYDEFLKMMNWAPLPEQKPAPAPAPAAPADPAKKGGDGTAAPAAKPAAPAADAGKDAGKKATDCQKLSDAAATCKANKEKKEAEDEAKKEEEKTKEEDKKKKEDDKTK